MNDRAYIESVQKFRDERNKRMTASARNWFSLAGLFSLEAGDSSFGSDSSNKIVLPTPDSPRCGVFHLENGKVTLTASGDNIIKINGLPVEDRPLRTDHDDKPDFIEAGSLIMLVIERGDRLLLRVWDKDAPAVKEFKGLNFYPINLDYCITAKFTPFDPPKIKKTQDVIGTEYGSEYVGQAQFTINGVECTLDAEADDDELRFSFTDQTKIDTTYPGGRFLVTAKPKNGLVTLDFNRAVNWPCAYTPYATCPLPPFENRLPVRIKAGEMKSRD
jgi:uncharacterized protein